MQDEILIWGAGAIGGTIGAYWARAGVPVRMVDIVAEHAAACASPGLSIEGPVEEFTQAVPCVTPDALDGTWSRIVLAVKAQATEAAMDALLPHLAEGGYVLSAQNGLNERTIAAMAGRERTMGAFVNFGADWLGPGRILFGNRGAVVVGEIDGTVRDRTREMHGLLQVFEPDAVLTDDIWGYLWGKMGYGAMLFATALTNDSMAETFADPARGPAERISTRSAGCTISRSSTTRRSSTPRRGSTRSSSTSTSCAASTAACARRRARSMRSS